MLAALALLIVPAPVDNPYAASVREALADARKIGAEALFTRYLACFNLPPNDREDLWRRAINHYANSTSRGGHIYRVRRVGSLLAINTLELGAAWPVAWENLSGVDPHFHVQILVEGGKQGKRFFPREAPSPAGWYNADFKTTKTVPALAPWTDVAAHAELVALTNSAVPIVRADFFVSQAFIQADRKGTGYYSFLGIRTVADFDELIGFDRKKAEKLEYQVAAIVRRSGVARFPRQIFIEQALTGKRAETRDVTDDNTDARNALRQLDGDYQFQALEIYGHNTIGMFVYAAANEKGELQDSVPDKLGFDKTTTDNDGRIHPYLGCARCHVEGYRPIDDWGRKNFSGNTRLSSPDPIKAHRLNYLYLGDLDSAVSDANTRYARALMLTTGWKPDEAAKAIGQVWDTYVARDYFPKDVALELGVKEEEYLRILRAYMKSNPLADTVLASHVANPPIPIRSDDLEQLYPVIATLVLATPAPAGMVTKMDKKEIPASGKMKP